VPALIEVFTAHLSQPAEANNLKPLHAFPRSAICIFPPFVDGKAECTDGQALPVIP
jgi:hypothetical protein